MDVNALLRLVVERGASDLHLRVPSPPVLRVNGVLAPLQEQAGVTPQDMKEALERVTTGAQREKFFKDLELDFAHSIPGLARFRVNAYLQRGTIGLAFRRVSINVPSIDELGLPEVCKTLALKPKGLVLVTGAAGMGKSTTLAAMIGHLNGLDRRNVITVEDPIEFLHKNEKCIIAQRELGDDTLSFAEALKHSLRQDPDVILVGEMRDLETMAIALTAAETGHLVLSTLHTVDAPQTIERIVDSFPSEQQKQIRLQLSLVLQGVVSQLLLPRADGKGRVVACEVMIANDAIRNLIREGKTEQILSYLQTGRAYGMQSMEQALANLVRSGIVTADEALARSGRPAELSRLLDINQPSGKR